MRGLTRCLILIFGTLFANTLVRAGALETSPCRLAHVPDSPCTRDRHTMLLAHFDSASLSDADYARVHVEQSGTNVDAAVEGRFGRGVAVHGQSGFVLFPGLDNYQRLTGTAEFWAPIGSDSSASPRWKASRTCKNRGLRAFFMR